MMYTIDGEWTEYPNEGLATAAAKALSRAIRRSVLILFNGKPYRLLRY